MKTINKAVACLTAFLVLLTVHAPLTFASLTLNSKATNKYSGYVERLDIDGTEYEYKYYHNAAGNRAISITNLSDGVKNIVEYVESASTVYINGEKAATIEAESFFSPESPTRGWVYFSSFSNGISWSGNSGDLLESIIAAVLGIWVGEVRAAIGAAVIRYIAETYNGATVYGTVYQCNPYVYPYEYKYVWYLKAGSTYGPYNTIVFP